MRADRLLSLLLLLQTRGKTTTQALADGLGVSRRTILRDVEALSLAGVPVYSEGGHGGGIALDESYRTTLTGLHTPEVRSLFISTNNSILKDIGLADAGERLLLKLLAALPVSHHPTVDHIRQRILIDPGWWWQDAHTPPFWDDLQRAVYENLCIDVTYEHYDGEVVQRILEPYSLVNKSSLWYLVAQRESELRTYRISRFHNLRLVDQSFVRRPDFDLQAYWQANLKAFVDEFTGYQCILCIHPDRVPFIKWLFAGRWQIIGESNHDGWFTFQLSMESPLLAKMLVFGLGASVEVIAPTDLAQMVLADALAIVERDGMK